MKNIVLGKNRYWICMVLLLLPAASKAPAEDMDAYRSFVKNNALLVVDTSAGMSRPVYDESLNYAAFMAWMIQGNLAVDENDGRSGTAWWDDDANGADYDRLDPQQIYLVSTYVDHALVQYTDVHGNAGQAAVIGDVLENQGAETDEALNKRLPLLVNAVIPCRSGSGVDWKVTKAATIEKDKDGRVLFPSGDLQDTEKNSVATPAEAKGKGLPNHRDIAVSGFAALPEGSGKVADGFVERLRSDGYYFSGLFEKSGPGLEFTANPAGAENSSGKRIYLFATGNFLNFIKLVEDFRLAAAHSAWAVAGTYSNDLYKAWRYVCCPKGFAASGAAGPQASVSSPCSNSLTSGGLKIKSRLEAAKGAMKALVQATQAATNWGLVRFDQAGGGKVAAPLGAATADLLVQIDDLVCEGESKTLGGALQDAYSSARLYLEAQPESAPCARNHMVLVTHGFPKGDGSWNRIKDGGAAYPNPVFGKCDSGYGACPVYGDGDVWPQDNHGDDAAHWLQHQASFSHRVHSLVLDRDNPLLQDMVDSGRGIWVCIPHVLQSASAFAELGPAKDRALVFSAPVVPVDPADRSQSGEDLYIAFARPAAEAVWLGNLKKYGLGRLTRTDCGRSEPEWVIIDKNGAAAVDCKGQFRPDSLSHWSEVPDGGEVSAGGAGAVLMAAFAKVALDTGPFYDFRNIYTCIHPAVFSKPVRFFPGESAGMPESITAADLGVTGNIQRDKIINYIYGYTYAAFDSDADPDTYTAGKDGRPVAKRPWILGDMLHGDPAVIDYFGKDHELRHRLVAAGANDGMLHIFVDDCRPGTEDTLINGTAHIPGEEIWAFIPGDLLPRLKILAEQTSHQYFVDGPISVHRSANKDGEGNYYQTLICGERRGGRSYWALDVTKPNPALWTVKWRIQGGSGDFPELGYTWSKPIAARIQTNAGEIIEVVVFGGGYDPEEDHFPEPWTDADNNGIYDIAGESYVDANANGSYDHYNPGLNTMGRAVYVVKIADGALLFKVNYSPEEIASGQHQTSAHMKYCLPADPTVLETDTGLAIYIVDIYAGLWKVDYDYKRPEKWQVGRVFNAAGGSDQDKALSALKGQPALNPLDRGRKAFYSPDVSYYGSPWTDQPLLFFGTGDREHPRYVPGSPNRFYAITDTGTTADETDLLNLTCDELDGAADVDGNGALDPGDNAFKQALFDILFGSSPYPLPGKTARGWYKQLGKTGFCHQEKGDHTAEMVLGPTTLYSNNVYFTTYQPVWGLPCHSKGHTRIYALEYTFGRAAVKTELSPQPLIDGTDGANVQATHALVQNSGLPSGICVVMRKGSSGAFADVGDSIVGVGEPGEDADGSGRSSSIPGPPGGALQLLWEVR